MNYAIYFGLTAAACFMSLMLFAVLLSWLSDAWFDDREIYDDERGMYYENYQNKRNEKN
jgi:hypothetical protein